MSQLASAPSKTVLGAAIRIMIIGTVLAMAYVILKSCSTPKLGLETFNEGSLKKLTVLDNPPPLPVTVFKGPNGEDVTLMDKRGKVILVNLWATWCAPCIAEIPSLDKLQALRGGENFEVVAISLDRNADDAREFLVDAGANNLALYHDMTFGIAKDAKAAGVPVSILYAKNGQELARLSGEADWASREALKLIDSVIAP